jgi:hypothetical protein
VHGFDFNPRTPTAQRQLFQVGTPGQFGSIGTSVDANAQARLMGQAQRNPNGLGGTAQFEASARAGVGTTTNIGLGGGVNLQNRRDITADAGVTGRAAATLDRNGANLEANAQARAGIVANNNWNINGRDGQPIVGVNSQVDANVAAQANAQLRVGPNGAGFNLGAQAGANLEGSVQVGSPTTNFRLIGGVSAGVGAAGAAHFDVSPDRRTISMGGFVDGTLGIGGKIGAEINVPNPVYYGEQAAGWARDRAVDVGRGAVNMAGRAGSAIAGGARSLWNSVFDEDEDSDAELYDYDPETYQQEYADEYQEPIMEEDHEDDDHEDSDSI